MIDVDVLHGDDVESSASLPDAQLFVEWAQAVAEMVSRSSMIVAVKIVSEKESQFLNSTYRSKNKPTNVLSFPSDLPVEIAPDAIGDLAICAAVVEREALEQGKSSYAHWAHMTVHGLLHLCGYDHIVTEEAEEMESLEQEILSRFDIANPYE